MQLGFVSAILGDLSLEQVMTSAADLGFACVELMCWPPGKADRRYAGVTHLDVTRVRRACRGSGARTHDQDRSGDFRAWAIIPIPCIRTGSTAMR